MSEDKEPYSKSSKSKSKSKSRSRSFKAIARLSAKFKSKTTKNSDNFPKDDSISAEPSKSVSNVKKSTSSNQSKETERLSQKMIDKDNEFIKNDAIGVDPSKSGSDVKKSVDASSNESNEIERLRQEIIKKDNQLKEEQRKNVALMKKHLNAKLLSANKMASDQEEMERYARRIERLEEVIARKDEALKQKEQQLQTVNMSDRIQFKVKRFKQKGSKEKSVIIEHESIVDGKGRVIIAYKDISQIAIGKVSEILTNYAQLSHAHYFSFIDHEQQSFDFEVMNTADRYFIIMQTLKKSHIYNDKEAIKAKIASCQGKDESFLIDIDQINADEHNKRIWIFKRHKVKGSKEGSIELTKNEIIWNNKTRIKLRDLKQIMLGKESKLLSDKNNQYFVNQPNEIFISFVSDNVSFDLSEINKNERMDLMFKVLDELEKNERKIIEHQVLAECQIRASATRDPNFRASYNLVEEDEISQSIQQIRTEERERQMSGTANKVIENESAVMTNEKAESESEMSGHAHEEIKRLTVEMKARDYEIFGLKDQFKKNEELMQSKRFTAYIKAREISERQTLLDMIEDLQKQCNAKDVEIARLKEDNAEKDKIAEAQYSLQQELYQQIEADKVTIERLKRSSNTSSKAERDKIAKLDAMYNLLTL